MTWFDWASADTALLDFTKGLIALRRAHPVFRRRRFLAGAAASELQWFTPAGTPMDGADWADPNARALAAAAPHGASIEFLLPESRGSPAYPGEPCSAQRVAPRLSAAVLRARDARRVPSAATRWRRRAPDRRRCSLRGRGLPGG